MAALATTFMDKLVENDWISLALVGVLVFDRGPGWHLKLHDIAIFVIGAVGGGYLVFSLWPTFTGTEPTIFIIAGWCHPWRSHYAPIWQTLDGPVFCCGRKRLCSCGGSGSYTALFIPLFLAGILIQYGSSSRQKRAQTYDET